MSTIQHLFKQFASPRKVAFVGNYSPRRCGIATFTHDLFQSFASNFRDTGSFVLSVNDVKEGYDYPPEVRFTFYQQAIEEYRNAAHFLNTQQVEMVCLQHEYGIYGGKEGEHIIHFMRALEIPIVTTLHTILNEPNPDQYNVMKHIIALSSKLIVMSEKGKQFLISIYACDESKIAVIPHGIPNIPFVDAHFYKDIFGLAQQKVLLTFGLISPNKGIETLISALPAVLKEFPNLTYMIVGATHPHLLKNEGEAYRNRLTSLIQKLDITEHIQFYNQFVSKKDLLEFIGAADIYITPYINEAQITSGTLAYSLGCGKAIISTPYWYAEELLADDCGVLTPFQDSAQMANHIISLLKDEDKRNTIRKKAYLKGREMTWDKVVVSYESIFAEIRLKKLTSNTKEIASNLGDLNATFNALPPLSLNHIIRMTDKIGIFQHARFCFPNFNDGYCTDDNARALVLTMELAPDFAHETDALTDAYMSFINHAFIEKTNLFHNFMSLDRTWHDDFSSDDCHGRAIWALGSVIAHKENPQMQQWALDLFEKALPKILDMTSPRAWAFCLLGIEKYVQFFSGDQLVNRIALQLENRLLDIFNRAHAADWIWFEKELSYDNARLCQAMLISKREECRNIGLLTLNWLKEIQTSETGYFQPIGSNGFYRMNGERAFFDQQPLEAAAMVTASLAAFKLTSDKKWLQEAHMAFQWFLGKNVAAKSMYNEDTAGCYDGLHVDRVNFNQGAESTISYLTALVELQKIKEKEPKIVEKTNHILISDAIAKTLYQ